MTGLKCGCIHTIPLVQKVESRDLHTAGYHEVPESAFLFIFKVLIDANVKRLQTVTEVTWEAIRDNIKHSTIPDKFRILMSGKGVHQEEPVRGWSSLELITRFERIFLVKLRLRDSRWVAKPLLNRGSGEGLAGGKGTAVKVLQPLDRSMRVIITRICECEDNTLVNISTRIFL
jgi:hypothetical protein